MELTNHQKDAMRGLLARADEEGVASLGGLAGTGKTTLLAELGRELGGRAMIVAPTGRAASVLRRKGVAANTIHSALYGAPTSERYAHLGGCTLGEFEAPTLDCIPHNCTSSPSWGGRRELAFAPEYLIVDEASMVNSRTLGDLVETGAKVILVGDHGQLPPVVGTPVISNPDFVLTEIHRQAAESPIIRAAYAVREGATLTAAAEAEGIPVQRWKGRVAPNTDVARICHTNVMRHRVNAAMREALGRADGPKVVVGERLLCLANVRTGPGGAMVAANGEVGTVREVLEYNEARSYALVKIDIDHGTQGLVQRISLTQLGTKTLHRNQLDGANPWDWGYALTCHKSQGSQWGTVGVYYEPSIRRSQDRDAWTYTAITRAEESLVVVNA